MNLRTLPPWGQLDEDFLSRLGNPPCPLYWLPSRNEAFRLKEWGSWRDEVAAYLAQNLWPQYDPKTGWSKKPSSRLIDADFELLKVLSPKLGASATGNADPNDNHEVFYRREDEDNWGAEYWRYDPRLDRRIADSLPAALPDSLDSVEGRLSSELKLVFQRPRPYQVAVILGKQGFKHLDALSGNTPSMVSGHCLQASLAGCAIYAQFRDQMSKQSIEIFGRFTIDIGDRRVYAGVHYPSDNLSSWYTALCLIPNIFEGDVATDVSAFLAGAIGKSVVFGAIASYRGKGGASPYAPMIKALKQKGVTYSP